MKLRTSVAMAAFIACRAASASAADCGRACLRSIVTQYLDAFVSHEPNAAFAPGFKYVQDLIDTKPGDGLWKEATHLRPYRIDILDTRLGVAGTMTLVEVDGGPAMVAAAAKIVDRKIVRLETLVAHNRTEGVLFDIDSLEKKTSRMGALVLAAARTPREEAIMTPEEHAALEKREQEQIVRMAKEGAGGATGAPGWWVEWGTSQLQTSLVVDPPDGRLPPLTADGQTRTARAPRGTLGGAALNAPEDFTYWERCISRGALGSTLPVLYNSGIDITQGPGYVAIRYEMVHDFRIIPIDRRPHVSPKIPLYMGDARARWDGDTLVVETTNFTDKIGVGLSGGGTPNSTAMRLVERFTRVSNDRIRYEATVDDPRTWTGPWTVAFPLTRTPEYGMFEYACHEGNHGMLNALSGSRAEDRAQ